MIVVSMGVYVIIKKEIFFKPYKITVESFSPRRVFMAWNKQREIDRAYFSPNPKKHIMASCPAHNVVPQHFRC